MIYIKNNTEIQTIFIPRSELQKEAYIASTKTYEDGYRDGFGMGKQYQKDQLLNLYATENGEYVREDGWGIVTVDVPIVECPDCPEGGSCNLGEGSILLDTSMAGTYELYASDDGYDGWSKFYVTLENGGAINWDGENGSINNSNFKNNTAEDGGAIYLEGSYGTLRNCNFINNQATEEGGAILWYGDNGKITYCNFTNNIKRIRLNSTLISEDVNTA